MADSITAGPGWRPSEADVAAFERDGYVIVKGLLTAEEIGKIKSEVEREDGVKQYAFRRDDGSGGGSKSQMALWNSPGKSTGAIAADAHLILAS
jgi:hypothetical protein